MVFLSSLKRSGLKCQWERERAEDTAIEGSNCQQQSTGGEYFLVFKGANCCVGIHSTASCLLKCGASFNYPNSPHRIAVLLQRVDTEHCLENTSLERFSLHWLSNSLKLELGLERRLYSASSASQWCHELFIHSLYSIYFWYMVESCYSWQQHTTLLQGLTMLSCMSLAVWRLSALLPTMTISGPALTRPLAARLTSSSQSRMKSRCVSSDSWVSIIKAPVTGSVLYSGTRAGLSSSCLRSNTRMVSTLWSLRNTWCPVYRAWWPP